MISDDNLTRQVLRGPGKLLSILADIKPTAVNEADSVQVLGIVTKKKRKNRKIKGLPKVGQQS